MPWTTRDDVIDRWIGDEVPATDGQLDVLIKDAEDMLTGEVPDLEAKVTTGAIPQARVVRVVVRMIQRVLRNPEGLRQQMHSSGPFTEQVMYAGDSPGGLEVTATDLRELRGRAGARRAFTVYPKGV